MGPFEREPCEKMIKAKINLLRTHRMSRQSDRNEQKAQNQVKRWMESHTSPVSHSVIERPSSFHAGCGRLPLKSCFLPCGTQARISALDRHAVQACEHWLFIENVWARALFHTLSILLGLSTLLDRYTVRNSIHLSSENIEQWVLKTFS